MPEPVPLPPCPWDMPSLDGPDPYGPSDCVVAGADLEPATIVAAYRAALFPMGTERGQQLWWSPQMRGILWPHDIHISRSLKRSLRRFTVTVDTAFIQVIDACADPTREGAWIDEQIRAAYIRLHELRWAHSVEVWDDRTLVGGLYGLQIGGLFAGESMFHHATDASKVALVELARRCAGGLIDVQWSTPHLASLGITEVPRQTYRKLLAEHRDQVFRDLWS